MIRNIAELFKTRFAVLILLVLLAACSASTQDSAVLPTYAPTSTLDITPVPLILTPIATPESLPPLPPVSESQSSKALAIYGDLLVAANPDSDSLSLVDLKQNKLLAEIAVGADPRSVAITPDGTRALVTLRGENTLGIVNLASQQRETTISVGHMPYGVVTDGRRAYISCLADDQIAVLDLESGEIVHRLTVPDAPAGLALSGEWLFVTHFYSGKVTLLNVLRTLFVVGSVDVEPDGNLAQSIILAPDGQHAYIPQTRTGLALVSLQYRQDWFPVVSVLDITTMTGNRDARMTLSMLDDEPANMPFDAAFSADGNFLYIVLAGSDAILVMDTRTNTVLARLPVGANPRGIVIQDERAFVLNTLDGTLSIIDTTAQQVTDTLQITQIPLDPQLLRGKVLFQRASAPLMSDGAISCATCHFEGGADARTWINFRSGPRNTPALGGIASLPPYNWAGDMNELQDTIEDQIRNVMLGDGLIAGHFDPTIAATDSGRSADLDALSAYVASLQAPPSPYREPDGSLSPAAQRGMQLFMSGSPECGCHAPPLYTDQKQHNLAGATFSMEVFGSFDTPSLRGLWASAPYLHDGVAQTLEELLTRTDPIHSVGGNLTEQQLSDLIAFLLSL